MVTILTESLAIASEYVHIEDDPGPEASNLPIRLRIDCTVNEPINSLPL